MKVNPYLQFNGNCAEATAFYERAFAVKAEVLRYKDCPPSEGYQVSPGTEDFVMHAHFTLGAVDIMLCDVTPDNPATFGNGVVVSVAFDNVDSAKSAFDTLKEGGEVTMELQETFWSKCFGSLNDKFGVSWMITIESEK